MRIGVRTLADLATSRGRTTLRPGFGLPLNYEPTEKNPDYLGPQLPTLLRRWDGRSLMPLTTLREMAMLQAMNEITDKPFWHEKIREERYARLYKLELLDSGRGITEAMAKWCIEELTQRAEQVPAHPTIPPPVFVYNGDVYKCDKFSCSSKLRLQLQEAVKEFEKKVPEDKRDWRPGSDGKIWDLITPSLFPLIYGRTRILADGETTDLKNCIHLTGQGVTIPVPHVKHGLGLRAGSNPQDEVYSTKFQWLPCEVDVSQRDAQITSYINNLHPIREISLYKLIEQVITASIPLWDQILVPLRNSRARRRLRIVYKLVRYKKAPPVEEDSHQASQKKKSVRQARKLLVIQPNLPRTFQPVTVKRPNHPSLKQQCQKQGLQVIVKMANIQLTPEKPTYEQLTWQVEGQMNEHIVATVVYFYDSQNIVPPDLCFRHTVNPEETISIDYRKGRHDWLPAVFGLKNGAPAVQEIGGVQVREGRLIAFPNILQHRLGQLELLTPDRPGHLKMIVLHLVDPAVKIISTANVPCQRRDWWQDWKENPPKWINLPPVEPPSEDTHTREFPIGLEEAEKLKLEMTKDRENLLKKLNKAIEDTVISLD